MELPVYLFTGFLESGKSTLIQDTISDPNFQINERTLLLLCEDGEVEYDSTVMANYHTDVVYVENEEQLSHKFLKSVNRLYKPARVIIECNGMWNISNLLHEMFPKEWIVAQILTTIDARTFTSYIGNMRSFMYEQLKYSEVIIFNRCDEQTRKSFLRSNVKAINPSAQLIYENMNGEINTLQEDELPFDNSQDHLTISDIDYGLWYMDMLEHVQKYVGKTVTFKGNVIPDDQKMQNMFLIGRYAMVCCADDTAPIGFVCYYKQHIPEENTWVSLTAQVGAEYHEGYDREVPVLNVIDISPCEPIEEELVYFS